MRRLFLIAACFGIAARAATMSREEIAVQSSKYEKYKVWISDISDTQQYYTSFFQNISTNSALYCDVDNIVPGDTEDSGCNETKYRENECDCTDPRYDSTCTGDCELYLAPWCLSQFTSSSWYPVLCDPYSNTFMPLSVCGPYENNDTSPGEPFLSYGVPRCSTGSPSDEGPENPEDEPENCLGLDAAMIDTFADFDFSQSNYTYEDAMGVTRPVTTGVGLLSTMHEDDLEIMYFGSNILGNFTIHPNYCLRIQLNSFNNGNFFSTGNSTKDHIFFINTNQTAEPPYGLKFLSGNAYMFGGSSTGTAPVTFSTDGSVHVVGLDNHGEVDFTNSQDVWLSGTTNQPGSTARFDGVVGNGFDLTNRGTVIIESGNFSIMQASNYGSIVVNGANTWARVEAIMSSGQLTVNGGEIHVIAKSHSGTAVVNAGDVHGTLIDNSGEITIASGVTGSLEILGTNTGTITNNANPGEFTLIETSFFEEVLTQSLTFNGLCTDEVDSATQDVIVESLASSFGVEAYLVNVRSVTGDACASSRRSRRMLTTETLTVEYEVYLKDEAQKAIVQSQMASVAGGSAGSSLASSVGQAIGSADGSVTLASAGASGQEPFTGYNTGGSSPTPSPSSSSDDDDFPTWAIGVLVGGGIVAVIAAAAVFMVCRSSNRH